MNRIRLVNTTTFRLVALAAALFAVAGTAVVALLYLNLHRLVDHRLDRTSAIIADDLVMAATREGPAGLRAEVQARTHHLSPQLLMLSLAGRDGRILAGNLDVWPRQAMQVEGPASIFLDTGSRERARIRVVTLADGSRILTGTPTPEYHRMAILGGEALLASVAVMALVGIGAGLLIARYALRRLDEVNRTAATILSGDLSGRVARVGSSDEFDQLADNLNSMLDRIQGLVGTVRGITHNIAHDLRTPLNRLRSRLEVALMAPRSAAEYEEVLSRAIEEADGVIATFNAMLRIARIEGGAATPVSEPVDLGQLAEAMADLYGPLAEESGKTLIAEGCEGIVTNGDPHLISQAINNLVDNAIKYTPEGGHITVTASRSPDGHPRIEVRDTGPGVPAHLRTYVIQRFTRLDSSRGSPGSGLGLSLVAAVAELHGAVLNLGDNNPGLAAVLTFRPAKG